MFHLVLTERPLLKQRGQLRCGCLGEAVRQIPWGARTWVNLVTGNAFDLLLTVAVLAMHVVCVGNKALEGCGRGSGFGIMTRFPSG